MAADIRRITDLSFLEEGDFTRIDDVVKQKAQELKNSPDFIQYLIHYVSGELRVNILTKDNEFRKREASQIISSGYVTGCTDIALVTCAITRSLGIPSIYVETLRTAWLQSPDLNKIKGHVFVDLFYEGKWRVFEPTDGFVENDEYALRTYKYTVVGKGLDFSKLYIVKEDGISEFSHSVGSLDQIIDLAKHYRPSVFKADNNNKEL